MSDRLADIEAAIADIAECLIEAPILVDRNLLREIVARMHESVSFRAAAPPSGGQEET